VSGLLSASVLGFALVALCREYRTEIMNRIATGKRGINTQIAKPYIVKRTNAVRAMASETILAVRPTLITLHLSDHYL